MQKQFLRTLLPLIVVVLALTSGCNKNDDTSSNTINHNTLQQDSEGSHKGSSLDENQPSKSSLQEAKLLFDQKKEMNSDSGTFNQFLNGYRNGIEDASRAKTSRISRAINNDNKESMEDSGYKEGYQSVITALGIIEYDCNDEGTPSEYRERWCEAANHYRLANIGSDNNPFIRSKFADGYMAGGRVALTVPASMESFFSGDSPEGKQPAITQPEGNLVETELAFYRGFDEGYKVMIASIKESINQVMEQMQSPNDMQLPDGSSPQAPQLPE